MLEIHCLGWNGESESPSFSVFLASCQLIILSHAWKKQRSFWASCPMSEAESSCAWHFCVRKVPHFLSEGFWPNKTTDLFRKNWSNCDHFCWYLTLPYLVVPSPRKTYPSCGKHLTNHSFRADGNQCPGTWFFLRRNLSRHLHHLANPHQK